MQFKIFKLYYLKNHKKKRSIRGVWAEKYYMMWQNFVRPEFAFPESKKLFPPMWWGGVVQLITLSTPTRVEVELG
jgi:hypothetical protein